MSRFLDIPVLMLLCAYAFSLLLVKATPILDSVSALTPAQIAAFKPYTFYASCGHCPSRDTLAWNCTNCAENPDFKPVAAGGDGDEVQFWYVGYDPTLKNIVVAYQGTDFTKTRSDCVDHLGLLAFASADDDGFQDDYLWDA
ncbi:hypothetical protein H0H92_010473 [Tricholoma furcatifolium]|nr:hypothetical protein H0H92_010473 [Tricholoma furcatifolium]